jgi:hypothetical protein
MTAIAINAVIAWAMVVTSLVGGAQTQAKPPADLGTAVTVGGCLRKWEPAMATKGVLNPGKLEYVLTELSPVTTAAPPQPNILRYLIAAKDSTVVLAPHVNHRVEVTGMATGLAQITPTTAANAAPTLTVSAVKMVSNECI